jgi:isopentenyl-diphosphate delta-isomerase
MIADRERHPVELVDQTGRTVGVETVAEAHQAPGQLHRAFSVVISDYTGRILLQRRSAAKTRFASLWANACCGHPAPGQSVAASANRRLQDELGLGPIVLTEAGVYIYYAEDLSTGRVEFEYDHVLIGKVSADHALEPNPDEVADLRWVNRHDLETSLSTSPHGYAPWLAGVIARLVEHESTTGPATRAGLSGGR